MAGEQQQKLYLSKGADVEVCSEDDGLEGAWFEANLLESLYFRLKSSSTEKKQEILVQYKTLVTEGDTPKPLREHVLHSMLRPPPPPPLLIKQVFGLNDVVDAFCNDAWWTGLVNGVLGDSRYSVLFYKPPDQQPFFNSQLRIHMDWVDGDWIRARKKGIEDFIFNVGSTVEVSLSDEGFQDAWFPANILEVAENHIYVVRCHNPTNQDVSGHLTKTLDIHHIRPHPPRMSIFNFSLLQKVDVFFDAAWREGVITKVLPNNKYMVFCKHSNTETEFMNTNLRFHVEWKDGKWLNSSQDLVWTGVLEHESYCNNDGSGNKKVAKCEKYVLVKENDTHKIKTGKKIDFAKDSNGKTTASPNASSRKKLKPNISNEVTTPLNDTLNKKENDEKLPLSIHIPKVDNTSTDSLTVHPASEGASQSLDGNQNKEVEKQTISEGGDRSKLRVECLSPNLGSEDTEPGPSEPTLLAHKSKGISIQESYNDSSTETAELSQNSPKENTNTNGRLKRKRGRPLKHLNNLRKSLEDNVLGEEIAEIDEKKNEVSSIDETPIKICNSSILKKSPLWKTVEAMEPFLLLPQNPHFSPLKKYRKVFQEGMAIGSMLTFVEIIDDIHQLQINDNRDCFTQNLEALSELEEHGFDVSAVRVRLNSLLALKDRSEHLTFISKKGETDLDKCYKKKTEIETEKEDVSKKKKELEKREAAVQSASDALNSEISSRLTRAKETTEELNHTLTEFEKLGEIPMSS